ncbi:unnamed protein product, partial [Amoebophrya sp. A25]|eukprot:GSA25T00017533001.1
MIRQAGQCPPSASGGSSHQILLPKTPSLATNASSSSAGGITGDGLWAPHNSATSAALTSSLPNGSDRSELLKHSSQEGATSHFFSAEAPQDKQGNAGGQDSVGLMFSSPMPSDTENNHSPVGAVEAEPKRALSPPPGQRASSRGDFLLESNKVVKSRRAVVITSDADASEHGLPHPSTLK